MRGRRSRAGESRKAQERTMPQTVYRGRLYIDPARIPQDVVYAWVAYTVTGEPNNANVQLKGRNGWRVVPSDRHPELGGEDIFGKRSDGKAYIEEGGLILCEMAKTLYRKREAEKLAAQQHIMKRVSFGTEEGMVQQRGMKFFEEENELTAEGQVG